MQRLDRAREDQGEEQRERDGHESDMRLVQQEPERAPRQDLCRRHGAASERARGPNLWVLADSEFVV